MGEILLDALYEDLSNRDREVLRIFVEVDKPCQSKNLAGKIKGLAPDAISTYLKRLVTKGFLFRLDGVKQAQLDACGMFGKGREIHTRPIPRGTQRIRPSRPDSCSHQSCLLTRGAIGKPSHRASRA